MQIPVARWLVLANRAVFFYTWLKLVFIKLLLPTEGEVLTKPEMGISCFLFVDLFPTQLLQVWKVSEIDDFVIIIPYK